MHLTLFSKTIMIIGMSTLMIVMQIIEMLSDAIPSGLMKISWVILMGFMYWFVVSVYKDYKEFKAKVYPHITDFHTRISVLESRIDQLR